MEVFNKKSPYVLEHVGARDTTYYVRYRKRGVRLDKVRLEADNREDAIEEAETLIVEAKKLTKARSVPSIVSSVGTVGFARMPELPPPPVTVTFTEVAAKIYAEAQKKHALGKLAKRTLDQYNLQLNGHLIPWFADHYPTFDEFLVDPKEAWLQFCVDRWEIEPEYKIYTHRQYALMVFLRAFENGIIGRKVKLDRLDGESVAGKWVPGDEITRLMLAANPVMRLQIQMASEMGMRRWEILRLRKDRLHLDRNVLRLEKEDCKIRKAREFKIPMSCLVNMKRHLLTTGDSPYLFPSPIDSARPVSGHKSAWDSTRRNANVECRFHDLRHSFITNALLVYGVSIEKVSQYCGVSIEVIEKVYLHNRAEFTAEIADKVDRSKSFKHVLEAVETA